MQKSSVWLASMVIAVLSSSPISVSAKSLLRPDDTGVVARGAQVYGQQCASCHGKNLEGQPDWRSRLPTGRIPAPPHDESGHTWHHNDHLLFRLTKEGPAAVIGNNYQSDMKGYAETLSDRDIIAVLSYIKSKWPSHVRARHDRINEAQR